MGEHRFGEHEAADEEKDDRVGERREDRARRRHLQDDRQHRADEGGDRERQGLGDPENHHHQQDGRQPVRGRGNRHRCREQDEQRERPGDEADGPAAPVEELLGRRVGLDGLARFVEAAHQGFSQ